MTERELVEGQLFEEQLVDAAAREAAARERARNVVVDAGAGSGKTSLLVRRVLQMVAPEDGAPALRLDRIAAITFTRRAAGELRFRIREALLARLTSGRAAPLERARLHEALGALDTAHVGTIHGFADRLLRLVPRKARVSPAYALADEPSALVRETHLRLLRGARDGTLAQLTGGGFTAEELAEAARALHLALEAGVPSESIEHAHGARLGLDALVGELIEQRDVPCSIAAPAPFDRERFLAALETLRQVASELQSASVGAQRIRRLVEALAGVEDESSEATLLRRLDRAIERFVLAAPMRKGEELDKHEEDWKRFKRLRDGERGEPPVLDALTAPARRWLATRLMRLGPVARAAYETVKREAAVLDHLDLLGRLRDLLDHILVDELQDTDPLQAEILVYLCDARRKGGGPSRPAWSEITLAPGKLTIVGDPKQSIYRFRRADVALYDALRSMLVAQGALAVELRTCFRTTAPLVEWANGAFSEVLGGAGDEHARFDPGTGRVFHRPLEALRAAAGPSVHVVPFESEVATADAFRAVEARALAAYLRWLVRASDVHIEDPHTGAARRPRYDDVAVLAFSTPQLPLLFAELDAHGVPYSARGGTLLLRDELSQRFLLGLRALSDPDDGVAMAALLRPPFFGLELEDLALEGEDDAATQKMAQARALVAELRAERLERPVSSVAHALIDRTALGRTVASMPNGAARLAHLRELCLVLHRLAEEHAWDFDRVTAHARGWVIRPAQLDPPRPLDEDAVEVLTVHQAKGLEWPVVVLWDSRAPARSASEVAALRLDRDGSAWSMSLSGVRWEEPEGVGLAEREQAQRDAERARLLYVAATRARDLLVLPAAGTLGPSHLLAPLLRRDHPTVRALARLDDPAAAEDARWWEVPRTIHDAPAPVELDLEAEHARFRAALASSASAVWAPRAVTSVASGDARGAPRLGARFGIVVHAALDAFARGTEQEQAISLACSAHGVDPGLLDAVRADVGRAIGRLRTEGWLDAGVRLAPEHPIAGEGPRGELLEGAIDLLVVREEEVVAVDYKTDTSSALVVPAHGAQLRLYAQLLRGAGVLGDRRLRLAILFTASGELVDVPEASEA